MKNKNILYILSIIIIIITLGLLSYNYINSSKNTNANNTASMEELTNKDTFSNEKSDVLNNSKMASLYTKLNEYADELYKKGEYTNYHKDNDMYFISLKEMNDKYEYDISIFVGEDGTVCDTELSGVYFDTEYKILPKDTDSDTPPIMPTLIKCSKEELDTK